MRVIVTCGPGYEPIDQVRRLTNFATGELGLRIAWALAEAGHAVLCLKGEMATAMIDAGRAQVASFGTNEDLARALEAQAGQADAIFHTAALCDYRVATIGMKGGPVSAAKIPTRHGPLTLTLEPALKVLPRLRGWFPGARIVGWKYELEGGKAAALERGHAQITHCGTDACVVNGAAWGAGFGFLTREGELRELKDKAALAAHIVEWLR